MERAGRLRVESVRGEVRKERRFPAGEGTITQVLLYKYTDNTRQAKRTKFKNKKRGSQPTLP